MDKNRRKIERLKQKLFADISQNKMKFKYSVIKQFELNRLNNIDLTNKDEVSNFEKELNNFKLSNSEKAVFINSLEETQNKIASVWNDYYGSEEKSKKIEVTPSDYNKMLAANSVDFKKIETAIREKAVREFRASIKGEFGVNALRKSLINSGLGFNEASAEANTALAQFDNSYNTQMALEAGIEEFIYDGIDQNSRPFCKEHLGKVYTIEELKAMDNGQGLPVETSLGGYFCTHYLTPYFGDKKKA
jgi:hypothetical protein